MPACLSLLLFALARQSSGGMPVRNLAPGDTVEIRCGESAAYCVRRTIAASGAIDLPGLPPIKIDGLTPDEAGAWLSEALDRAGRVLNPHVVVRAVEGKALTVSVAGLVAHPETRYLSPGLTIQELLAEAGPATGADPDRVLVVEVDGTTLAVDPTLGPWPLRPGDEVRAIARSPRTEVFLIGGVQAPGAIPFEPGMTVGEAVSRVGGVSADGQIGGWRVAHAGAKYLTLGDTPDATGYKLDPGDTVEVPVSSPLSAVSVIGAVVQPSRVEFRRGARLSTVLKAAGGLRPDANASHIAIRSSNGAVLTASTGDPVLKPGDWIIVPSAG